MEINEIDYNIQESVFTIVQRVYDSEQYLTFWVTKLNTKKNESFVKHLPRKFS